MKSIETLISQTKRLSVLYVEDNEQARMETVEILRLFFEQTVTAVDGKEGAEKFAAGDYDLIFTDINMPKLDGLGMITKIREVNDDVPIVIVSAYDETDYFISSIKLGVEAYLLKPFTLEDLLGVIEKVTEKIVIKHELALCNSTLEERVREQVDQISRQNEYIAQQARLAGMGEMISNIAHQWRQPLNRINSNIAVISTMLKTEHIDRAILESKIKNVKQNTKYMSDTIEDFANFFHPEKRETRFSILESVKGSLKLIESRLRGIDVKIKADEDITVLSFEKEYRQVILAIMNNAIDNFEAKATEKPEIEITIKDHTDTAYLCIHDNGGGIEAEDASRVFEPYYTTKFANEGRGLGLYMAKMLVESSMRGQLQVRNINDGACFEIEISKKAGDEG
ncbi:MAG: response regulator [Campylobacterota bacterium]|nr:response regulator [Campylobacterota bacterium]